MTNVGHKLRPNHDLQVGHLDRCQICESKHLIPVIDLGHQAPCDSLLTPAQLNEAEYTYPLRLVRCLDCSLVQIDYVVPPEVLFHPEYPYRSGITPTLVRNLQATATTIVDRFALSEGALAIDIGSNDGTLLKGFKSRGLRVIGVEATNVANLAIADGVDTVQAFFSEEVARNIRAEHGPAAAITATNMFAHIPNLGDLLRGVEHLLEPNGVFVTESHYLLDLIETRQYDSIYHEHLKYYSLRSLVRLFDYYDFTVVDADRIPNYGGSIRVYAVKGSGHDQADRLKELLALEEAFGLYSDQCFIDFAKDVRKTRTALQTMLLRLAGEGLASPGIGCPGRSSTLLNYCGIDSSLMPYIAEQSTSLKLGLHLPGRHIPIVDEAKLFAEQPEYAVMLSWHYSDAIIRGLRAKGLKSKIIVPLPEVRVVDV